MLFAIPSLLLLVGHQAQAGRETGNGGDAIALEFKAAAIQVYTAINAGQTPAFPEVNMRDFQRALDETGLVVVDQVFIKGVEKDAANFPDKKLIEISRTRWLSVSSRYDRKLALVFHEYLGIMGIADSDYAISSRLLKSPTTNMTNAGPQNFSASCEKGPITLASECYPQIGIHIRGRYDEAKDCATSVAMSQCLNAGLLNCAFQGADNGVALGNQCRVSAYVTGTKLSNGGMQAINPVIVALRESFARAKTPTAGDLKIGHPWRCKSFISAGSTDSASDSPPLLFSLVGQFVKNVSPDKMPSETSPVFYSFSSSALAGSTPGNGVLTAYYTAIKVNADGNLIGEQSWLMSGDTTVTAQLFPAAIYNSSYFANTYFTCD